MTALYDAVSLILQYYYRFTWLQ